MDRVGFGRALGVGAREAAKALKKAADAAAAPNPAPTRPAAPVAEVQQPPRKAVVAVAQKVERAKVTTAGLKRGGKRFGEAMWGPLAKAGSVLWLEVTGGLFAMFALTTGVWSWNNRGDLMRSGLANHQEWGRVAMLTMFTYLTVSNYVRAARRNRR